MEDSIDEQGKVCEQVDRFGTNKMIGQTDDLPLLKPIKIILVSCCPIYYMFKVLLAMCHLDGWINPHLRPAVFMCCMIGCTNYPVWIILLHNDSVCCVHKEQAGRRPGSRLTSSVEFKWPSVTLTKNCW